MKKLSIFPMKRREECEFYFMRAEFCFVFLFLFLLNYNWCAMLCYRCITWSFSIFKCLLHLQVLSNIGYIPCVVQCILECIFYIIFFYILIPCLAQLPSLSWLVTTSLFSISVTLPLFFFFWLYSLVCWIFKIQDINYIIQHLSFCLWFISLNILSFKAIHVASKQNKIKCCHLKAVRKVKGRWGCLGRGW